jgi:hypothetical protein
MNQENRNTVLRQVQRIAAEASTDRGAGECLAQIRAILDGMETVHEARREGLCREFAGHERAALFAERAGFHLLGDDVFSFAPGDSLIDPVALACFAELCENAALADLVEMIHLGLNPSEMGARVLDPEEIALRHGRGQQAKAIRDEAGGGQAIQLFDQS